MKSSSGARRLLAPLVPAYRVALAIRDLRLRRGWEPVRRLRFPVISVGNLSTGGAGKTPFTIALARALTTRGFAVDVLSRGYGRKGGDAARVDPAGSAEDFGDEPVLIARDARVPVYVARKRYQAGLLAERPQDHPSGAEAHVELAAQLARLKSCPDTEHTRVHILDDGFQHRQLYREIDILLLSGEELKDRLLPAGNLREALRAADRAHMIAIPENDVELETELRTRGWQGPVWRLRRHMEVPRVDGPAVAFCGIARPEQFFAGLEAAELRIAARVAFRDHHRYTARDIERLKGVAKGAGAQVLVTTEKDAIRLEAIDRDLRSPTFATHDVAKMGHGGFVFLTAGLRIEIKDESAVMDWIARRLREAAGRPSV